MAVIDQQTGPEPERARRTALWTGALLGTGLMGAVDEIAFHQLLQWHNFYVHADRSWRIASDGLFHLFTAALLFAGALQLWRQRRLLGAAGSTALAAGLVLGMGGFQLFDGTVNHKLLRLHPVREGAASQWPYDLAWIAGALIVLAIGVVLLRDAARATSAPGGTGQASSARRRLTPPAGTRDGYR